ncbi:hypothetical protein [Streptomyces cinerochromogenes]|uniref:hypothetical protein n=1 Tax=Streptomyces cinerochromogenes TaxID=66422 RepID=UPI0016704443|nr:hypothetical protein [Streptomyces cinerochromogenes]GGS84989.1 hypothetical protein GCM10010206_54600 [Streptomyces cinerochromogenes]
MAAFGYTQYLTGRDGMSLLTETAGYYRQFRPGIPEDVTETLDQAAPNRSDGGRRLLDIRTGTGPVAAAGSGRTRLSRVEMPTGGTEPFA